ncbi:hypothetical protein [Microbacterium terregens]|uniref:Uncharacterized protein n=1 Tax=Microbacterium terregens TaxID=69363 RepID=A0ABV5SW05_9MICO
MCTDPTDDGRTAGSFDPGSDPTQRAAYDWLIRAARASAGAAAERALWDEVDSSLWQDSIAASNYDQARARVDVNRLLHYGHPIPVSRGFTAAFVSENYPGWTWNELIGVLKDAGVVIGGVPPHCEPGVGAVHFDADGSWLVEWEDGRITRSTC